MAFRGELIPVSSVMPMEEGTVVLTLSSLQGAEISVNITKTTINKPVCLNLRLGVATVRWEREIPHILFRFFAFLILSFSAGSYFAKGGLAIGF